MRCRCTELGSILSVLIKIRSPRQWERECSLIGRGDRLGSATLRGWNSILPKTQRDQDQGHSQDQERL